MVAESIPFPNLAKFDAIILKVARAIAETYSPDDPFGRIPVAQDFMPWMTARKENKLMLFRNDVMIGLKTEQDFENFYQMIKDQDEEADSAAPDPLV